MSDQYPPPPPSMPPPPPDQPSKPEPIPETKNTSQTVAYAGLAGAAVGSLLPWAEAGFITVNGTDGDGVLTLIGSIVAAGVYYKSTQSNGAGRGLRITAFVITALVALIYIYDLVNISSLVDTTGLFEVSVGIGLYIGVAGSIAATVALGKIAFLNAKRPT